MKVVPLNDKIVVQRLEAEEKTAGGIVLPDTAKEKPKQGKVLSVGDGKLTDSGKRIALQVKEGDRVLFTSDYPYGSMKAARQFFDQMPINVSDKEKIAHLNAERLLKLSN